MAFMSDITRFDTGVAHRFNALIHALRQHIARRAIYLQTHGELSALSDRDLNDLGLSRADIPAIARQAADQG